MKTFGLLLLLLSACTETLSVGEWRNEVNTNICATFSSCGYLPREKIPECVKDRECKNHCEDASPYTLEDVKACGKALSESNCTEVTHNIFPQECQ